MRSRSEQRRLASVAGAIGLALAVALLFNLRETSAPKPALADRVVIVSLDGVPGGMVQAMGPRELPALYSLAARGAWTWNARTDLESTETMPNHTSMLTGRSVAEHGYDINTYEPGARFAAPGLFDVVDAAGKEVAVVVSKEKMRLFADRWAGQIDDASVAERDDTATLAALESILRTRDPALVFVHLAGPDRAGHEHGWDGDEFREAMRRVDQHLAAVVARAERLPGRTAIVVTSDHGGSGSAHNRPRDPTCFTVPLVIVVPGLATSRPLYALNDGRRADPGRARTSTTSSLPPIRSAELANIALTFLGLGPVPDSTANPTQDLRF